MNARSIEGSWRAELPPEVMIYFGSDFTVADPCVTRTRVEHAYLSAEEKQDILSRNAYQLLARLGKTFPAA